MTNHEFQNLDTPGMGQFLCTTDPKGEGIPEGRGLSDIRKMTRLGDARPAGRPLSHILLHATSCCIVVAAVVQPLIPLTDRTAVLMYL